MTLSSRLKRKAEPRVALSYVWVEPEVAEQMRALADHFRITRAEAVRLCLEWALEEWEKEKGA